MAGEEVAGEIWAIAAPGGTGPVDVRVFVRGLTNLRWLIDNTKPIRLLPAGVPSSSLVIQNLGAIPIEIGNDRSLVYGEGMRIAANSSLANGSVTPGGPGSAVIESFAKAALPAIGNPGRLARLTDYDRGIWLDDGTLWRSVTGRVFDVTAFGAKADNGVTDNGPPVLAAIQACDAAGGGEVVVPSATAIGSFYGVASLVVLDNIRSGIRVRGGMGSLTSSAELRWSGGAGSGPMIRADSSANFHFIGLRLSYSNAAYDGDLFKQSHIVTDSSNNVWEDCEFTGVGTTSARTLLSMSATIISTVRHCFFLGAQVGIRIADPAYGAATQYTDVIQIENCSFNNMAVRSIRLGGSNFGTIMQGNTFEPSLTGAVSGVDTDPAAVGQINTLYFVGNWCGDANAAGGLAWLSIVCPAARAITISGNNFETVQAAEDAVVLGNFTGAIVSANVFSGSAAGFALNVSVAGSDGLAYHGNFSGLLPRNLANCLHFHPAGNSAGAGVNDLRCVSRYIASGVLNITNNVAGTFVDFGGAFTIAVTTIAGDQVCVRIHGMIEKLTAGNAEVVMDRSGTKRPASGSSTLHLPAVGAWLPAAFELWDTPAAGTYTYKPQLWTDDANLASFGGGWGVQFVVEVWRPT